MLKQVAVVVVLVAAMGIEVHAGVFGARGGCPNGQCSVRTYQPAGKVAVQSTEAPPKPDTQVAASSAAPANQQPQSVASQNTRRTLFRRISR